MVMATFVSSVKVKETVVVGGHSESDGDDGSDAEADTCATRLGKG